MKRIVSVVLMVGLMCAGFTSMGYAQDEATSALEKALAEVTSKSGEAGTAAVEEKVTLPSLFGEKAEAVKEEAEGVAAEKAPTTMAPAVEEKLGAAEEKKVEAAEASSL